MIHSYPWYIADWRESESRIAMNCEARGLYREVLDYCWWEGSLPTNEAAIRAIAGVSEKEFKRAWPSVKPHFYESDGRLRHVKVDAGRPRLESWREARSRGAKAATVARAKANAKANAIATLDCTPPSSSSSYSSSPSSSYPPNPQPMDVEFEEIWQAYPAKGRTRRPMCEQYYATTIMGAGERAMELHREILEPLLPGGKWERSKLWGNGFVSALADYLANKRWLEDPEPKGEWD